MSEQKRPVLTLRRKPAVTAAEPPVSGPLKGPSAAPEASAPEPAALTGKAARKAERTRLWQEQQERERAARRAAKQKPAPPPVYRKMIAPEDAIMKLEGCWPDLVRDGKLLLLATGIREVMQEDIHRRALSLSVKQLKRCLAAVTRSDDYLEAMTEGASRYDIFGRPVATVTASEAAYAGERRAQEHEKAARRRAAEQKQLADSGSDTPAAHA